MKKILGKDFFGKDNCLKAYLNEKLEFYLEFVYPFILPSKNTVGL